MGPPARFPTMPRYDYQCAECGEVAEHTFTMAEKPDVLSCDCGGVSTSLISRSIEVLVTGNTRPFKLDATCVPVGWEHGNTDVAAQERRYSKMIAETKKAAIANDKQAIKGGVRCIGRVPRELDRMRRNQYGKDYWQQDTKKRLAEDGLLFKN